MVRGEAPSGVRGEVDHGDPWVGHHGVTFQDASEDPLGHVAQVGQSWVALEVPKTDEEEARKMVLAREILEDLAPCGVGHRGPH